MNINIKTLFDFLGRFEPEVVGREVAQPKLQAVELLERFARGECDEAERAEVCVMLRDHPGWLRWLAERVKQSRTQRMAAPQE